MYAYINPLVGQSTQINNFSLLKLLPETRGYITYEGSMTEPGCQETVTWVIMNRPIYVTPQQVIYYKYGKSTIRLKYRKTIKNNLNYSNYTF